MPITGDQSAEDRVANCLEDICDKLDDLMAKESVVQVNVPENPALPAPVINIEGPPRAKEWICTVHRDSNLLIETITIRPKR